MVGLSARSPHLSTLLRWRWTSEQDTEACAQQLAACTALERALVSLRGDLGAGKTTWVRYLLRALGVSGVIKSPTYGLLEPYEATTAHGTFPVAHLDLYRLHTPQDLTDAGLDEVLAGPGLRLVEWLQQAGALAPTPDLELAISLTEEGTREVVVTSHTALGGALQQPWR
ncbi:MAG: tRNA (adenosine(37)-N6)-threonylcarbamoyltransferase complex ATPase subunit type 1 TsaE [Burkholderiaceae bacterium]